MVIPCPAKINLGLEVIRKRADGFHDINSVFLPIPLADDLTIERAAVLSLVIDDPSLPADETNLCMRAARAMQRAFGKVGLGARMELVKRIPMGAGLGGGSSDAAGVIRGLNELWEIDASMNALESVAASVGSDVPFFLHARPMLARGRGEQLTPIDVPLRASVVLVCPGIHIATPWAYAALDMKGEREATPYESIIPRITNLASLRDACVNDFERVVFAQHPEIGQIKERLLKAGAAYASMTGSGSAVYGMFDDASAAHHAAGEFEGMRVHTMELG